MSSALSQPRISADHPRAFSAAAVMDREQPAVLGRLDDFAAGYRRQAQVAAHEMQVVARQQDDVAGPDHQVSLLAVDPNMKFTLDDVVIKNHVRRWPERRRAVFRCDAGGHTPRREEIGVQEHAAGQMRHSQNIGQCIHAGLSIRSRCSSHVSRQPGHRPSRV